MVIQNPYVVNRIRVILRLKTETGVKFVAVALAVHIRQVEEVAGVELYTGLVGVDVE